MLKKEMTAEMKKLDDDLKSQIAQLGKGKKERGDRGEPADTGDGDEEGASSTKRRNDDEESEIGDGDADDQKRARQKKEQATYEDDSEGEEMGAYEDDELEAELADGEENEGLQQNPTDVKGVSQSFKTESNLSVIPCRGTSLKQYGSLSTNPMYIPTRCESC